MYARWNQGEFRYAIPSKTKTAPHGCCVRREFRSANIRSLAIASQAGDALRRKCAPVFARRSLFCQSKALRFVRTQCVARAGSYAIPSKTKTAPRGCCFCFWWNRGKSKRTRVRRMISQYFSGKIGDFARFSLIFYHFPDCHFRLIFVPTSTILVYKLISSEANVSFCLR